MEVEKFEKHEFYKKNMTKMNWFILIGIFTIIYYAATELVEYYFMYKADQAFDPLVSNDRGEVSIFVLMNRQSLLQALAGKGDTRDQIWGINIVEVVRIYYIYLFLFYIVWSSQVIIAIKLFVIKNYQGRKQLRNALMIVIAALYATILLYLIWFILGELLESGMREECYQYMAYIFGYSTVGIGVLTTTLPSWILDTLIMKKRYQKELPNSQKKQYADVVDA